MNADFCVGDFKKLSKSEGTKNDWDLKYFMAVTVVSLGIGAAVGTTLAIALDLPPVLGICHALHSQK